MLHRSITIQKSRGRVRLVSWQAAPDRRPTPIGSVRNQASHWVAISPDNRIVGRFDRIHEAANALRLHLLAPFIRAEFPEVRDDQLAALADLAFGSTAASGTTTAAAASTTEPVPASRAIEQQVATPASPLPSRPPWAGP